MATLLQKYVTNILKMQTIELHNPDKKEVNIFIKTSRTEDDDHDRFIIIFLLQSITSPHKVNDCKPLKQSLARCRIKRVNKLLISPHPWRSIRTLIDSLN